MNQLTLEPVKPIKHPAAICDHLREADRKPRSYEERPQLSARRVLDPIRRDASPQAQQLPIFAYYHDAETEPARLYADCIDKRPVNVPGGFFEVVVGGVEDPLEVLMGIWSG